MCRLMGMALGPRLPPLDVRRVVIVITTIIIMIEHACTALCMPLHLYNCNCNLFVSSMQPKAA